MTKDPSEIDGHWRPQVAICPFCGMRYNVYGRLETILEDTAYILMKSNLTDLLEIGKANGSPVNKTISREQRSNKFWMDVNSTMIEQLYQIYEMDFKLFGYNMLDI